MCAVHGLNKAHKIPMVSTVSDAVQEVTGDCRSTLKRLCLELTHDTGTDHEKHQRSATCHRRDDLLNSNIVGFKQPMSEELLHAALWRC
jgi:hypothetical protein